MRPIWLAAVALVSGLVMQVQAAVNPLNPEVIRLRGFLEESIGARYRAGLSNLLEKGSFNLSVQVELAETPPKPQPSRAASLETIPPELTLGMLDFDADTPEGVYGFEEKKAGGLEALFEKYTVARVEVNVGVPEAVGDSLRDEVEKWVRAQVKAEFGALGRHAVQFIRKPPPEEKKEPVSEKTWIDRVSELQNLLGMLSLAVIGFGMFFLIFALWSRTSLRIAQENRKAQIELTKADDFSLGAPPPPPAPAAPAPGIGGIQKAELTIADSGVETACRNMGGKVRKLAQTLGDAPASVLTNWAKTGEHGRMKIACFLEAATEAGTPVMIPEEAKEGLVTTFQAMTELQTERKYKLLQEVYWELIAYRNLGKGEIERPFGFLEEFSSEQAQGPLKEMLLDQNPRMQTLVALHMPDITRRNYLKGLATEGRMELVREALRLDRFKRAELFEANEVLKNRVAGGFAGRDEIVALPMVPRLLDSFAPLEELQLLGQMDVDRSEGVAQLRMTYASPAFLGYWPREILTTLMESVPAGEVVCLLRAQPSLQERIMPALAGMTAQVVQDDLQREGKMADAEKNRLLGNIKARMFRFLEQQPVTLADLIAQGEVEASAAPAADAEVAA